MLMLVLLVLVLVLLQAPNRHQQGPNRGSTRLDLIGASEGFGGGKESGFTMRGRKRGAKSTTQVEN